MWHSRMFWRLFGAFGLLMLAAIGLLGTVIIQRVERHELQQIEESLRAKAVLLAEMVREQPHDRLPALRERVAALNQQIATRITLIDADGWVLADSDEDPARMKNHADRPEVKQAQSQPFGSDTRRSDTIGRPMMYVALRSDTPGSAVEYVRVALPLDQIHERLAELQRIVWTAAALTGGAALLLAFGLARRISRPLQELTAGAENIAAGRFDRKVYALGHDEVGTLARAFNSMSERLEIQIAQLEEDREQLRAVLSGMVEGVIALDAEQQILFANERAGQLLGFKVQSVVGRKLWEAVRQRSIQDIVQRALTEPAPQLEELNWQAQGGRSLSVHAARLTGSPARGVVLVLHDTSELRRLERMRHEFVANVSHELKTPLSVIKAAVETLVDGALDDAENRDLFLEQIADQADRLHSLILDLLSLARIESGAELFEMQTVPLAPVVADCLERHRGRAEAKGQRLETNPSVASDQGPPGPPAVAWADEEAVVQILDNLVDNALKYTPAGGRICVRWGVVDGQVSLEVEDSGIGIPERDLPRIFERFYRVDKARSRELGGTGLGLAIVKHLVQAMQGSIRASSQLGRGTTFTVRLPRAAGS